MYYEVFYDNNQGEAIHRTYPDRSFAVSLFHHYKDKYPQGCGELAQIDEDGDTTILRSYEGGYHLPDSQEVEPSLFLERPQVISELVTNSPEMAERFRQAGFKARVKQLLIPQMPIG